MAVSSQPLRSAHMRRVVAVDEVGRGKPAPTSTSPSRIASASLRPAVRSKTSTIGLRSALAAGLLTIAVPQNREPPDPSVLGQAALVLESLSELTVGSIESIGRCS